MLVGEHPAPFFSRPARRDDPTQAALLVLRTGETLPCRVEAITPEGVSLQMPGGPLVVVPHAAVQAVELIAVASRGLPAEVVERLLMLPRAQRDEPPTHLLRSPRGDYLRGRLLKLDAKTAQVAVGVSGGGAPLEVPRSDVARIIWLHPGGEPWAAPDPAEPTQAGLPVEAVAGGGARVRVVAQSLDGGTLVGANPAIGACRVDLTTVKRLLIGAANDTASPPRPYAQWVLRPAPEPRNLPPRQDPPAAQPAPAPPPPPPAPRAARRPPEDAAGQLQRTIALLAREDARGLVLLVRLLEAGDTMARRAALDLLRRVTGRTDDVLPFDVEGPEDRRRQQAAAWRQWLAREAISTRLTFPVPAAPATAAAGPEGAGRLLVCRLDNRLIERDASGKKAWTTRVAAPSACAGLPNGHRLAGSLRDKALIEFDENGIEVWRARALPAGPTSVQRLGNGNTLAALPDANRVVEVDALGQVVWDVTIEGGPTDAHRLPDGRTLVALYHANRVVEIDAQGAEAWAVDDLPGPRAVQRLPGGRTLVVLAGAGELREVDRDGKAVWSRAGFNDLADAQRLPDGNTLVLEARGVCSTIDRTGILIHQFEVGSRASRLCSY